MKNVPTPEMVQSAKLLVRRGQWYAEEKLVAMIAPEPAFPTAGTDAERDAYHAAMHNYWVNVYHAAVEAIRMTGAKAVNRGLNTYAWRLS